MGKILAFFRVIVLILSMAVFVFGFLISLLFTKNSPQRSFNLRRNWVRVCLKVLGIKIEKKGEILDTPALYVSNHRNFVDPVIASLYVDAYVIAKAEVANYPILDKGARLTGVVYVKRESQNSRQEARDKMIELIKSGFNVMVYPEGTTNGNAETKDFKKGTFYEAAELGIPVIPIAVEYARERDMWRSGGMVNHYFKQFSALTTLSKIEFGPSLTHTDGAELTKMAKDWIDSKLTEMQQDWSEIY